MLVTWKRMLFIRGMEFVFCRVVTVVVFFFIVFAKFFRFISCGRVSLGYVCYRFLVRFRLSRFFSFIFLMILVMYLVYWFSRRVRRNSLVIRYIFITLFSFSSWVRLRSYSRFRFGSRYMLVIFSIS